MTTRDLAVRAMTDPEAALEDALIEEFLRTSGYDPSALPSDRAERLLAEACAYATSKLAEVEARARFIHEIHGES